MTERSEQLVSLFLQDPSAMTEEQSYELSKWISQDTANTKEFIRASIFHRCIHEALLSSDEERNKILRDNVIVPDVSVESFNKQFWDAILKEEMIAPKVEIGNSPVPAVEIIQKVRREKTIRKINKTILLTFVISAAAMIFLTLYVRLAPPAPYEVATVSDSINAKWSSDMPINPGSRIVSNSRPIRLTEGIVKLQTDDQVQIVLEAPTEFMFRSSSEIAMNYGRLFARVSKTGLGFSVITPNSKIVDLGTEFGVLGHIDGNTEVHLYKGKANLFAGEKNKPKLSQLLMAGSARKVDSRDSNIKEIALDEQALVRNIDSSAKLVWRGQKAVRLTDLLLGGNGFGTAVKQSLEYNTETGMAVDSGATWYRPSPGKPVSVTDSPYLDSIFVPGSEGDITVSSAFFDPLERTWEQTRKQFKDSGALYLHSNIGLTVDLNAVRQVVPGLRISSFSAFAGIIRMGNNTPDYSEVDVWVLVDGQLRSGKKGLRADQGYDVKIDINDADNFLSLIVTDGGKVNLEGFPANHFDTCGFADPLFEVEPK
ncbi:MAG: FecR family protein [Desulfobacterales bacterium]|nr:FecR family protein [Desulfobacterales bacterium]